MIFRFIADFILVFHLCFILFAVFGGLLVLYRRSIWKLHLPALIWGFLVQYFVWFCPLTTWENYFRTLGGEAGYDGGFVEYYISSIIYPEFISPNIHLFLAFLLVAFNLLVYFFVFRRTRFFA